MIKSNSLYHADCLTLLERIDDGIARVVYLDPPWFGQSLLTGRNPHQGQTTNGLRGYLENFARVLQQCYRILADNGSIIVHSEPSLAQKLNLLLNQVFANSYRDEYILPNFRAGQGTRHGILIHYGKGASPVINEIFRSLSAYEGKEHTQSDERGAYKTVSLTTDINRPLLQFEWRGIFPPAGQSWRFGRERLEALEREGRIVLPANAKMPRMKAYIEGIPVGTIWDDLQPLLQCEEEVVDFVSQQPVRLLERVIQMASNPEDVIVDPYCGTGTALIAAHRHNRHWIGGDSSAKAIEFCRSRLESERMRGLEWKGYSAPDLAALESKPCFYRRMVIMLEDLNAAEVLIAEGENEWVERKIAAFWNAKTHQKDDSMKDKLIRSVAGFLNSVDGGTVLLGVANDGNVSGLKEDFNQTNSQRPGRDSYELWIRQTLNTKLGFEFSKYVSVSFEEIGGNDVCLIRVAPGNRPAFIDDKLSVRKGNQTLDLFYKQAVEYAMYRWPR